MHTTFIPLYYFALIECKAIRVKEDTYLHNQEQARKSGASTESPTLSTQCGQQEAGQRASLKRASSLMRGFKKQKKRVSARARSASLDIKM